MKTRILAAGLCVLVSAGANRDLLACGDKFLVGSRGTRFQRAPTLRQPAAILVYANPASQLPRALSNLSVDATLRKAGYRPTSVASVDAFDEALRQGGWDLVLVDVADSQAVSSRLQGHNVPVVLPVLYNPTGTQLAQAKRQYPRVLRAPTKNQELLDAVDEALALKAKVQASADRKPTR